MSDHKIKSRFDAPHTDDAEKCVERQEQIWTKDQNPWIHGAWETVQLWDGWAPFLLHGAMASATDRSIATSTTDTTTTGTLAQRWCERPHGANQ